MRIALVTDTHFGVRNDNAVIANQINAFFDDLFFPYLKEHGITQVIHLGDVCDRRRYVNFLTAKHLNDHFFNPLIENNIKCDIIVGNHDCYYKSTNEINSVRALYENSLHCDSGLVDIIWDKPKKKVYDDLEILLCPWICTENYEQSFEHLHTTSAQIVFGHFEITGFEMHKGMVSHEGWNKSTFERFDVVCSGHYHHKSKQDNINYLGAPYQITWSDFDDERGFHVFDTQTRELEFIPNNKDLFKKVWYDGSLYNTISDVSAAVDQYHIKDVYAKVIVKNKENPYLFSAFIEKLHEQNPIELKVVDAHLNANEVDEDDLIDDAEDTLTILMKYVNNGGNNKDVLKTLVVDLYQRAMDLE